MDEDDLCKAEDFIAYLTDSHLRNFNIGYEICSKEGGTCPYKRSKEDIIIIKPQRIYVDYQTYNLIRPIISLMNLNESILWDKIFRSWNYFMETEYLIKITDEILSENSYMYYLDRSPCQEFYRRFEIQIDEGVWKKFKEICKKHDVNQCVMIRNSIERFLTQMGNSITTNYIRMKDIDKYIENQKKTNVIRR